VVEVRWYPDNRKPDNAAEVVQAIERVLAPTEAGRVDLDMVECGWRVSRAERLPVDKGEAGCHAAPQDMRIQVEDALAAAGLVINRVVPLELPRGQTIERMPNASEQSRLITDRERSQTGAEPAQHPDRIDRRATFSTSKERRRCPRRDQPVWLRLRLTDEAGRLLCEERTVAENTSPVGARVATSIWWLNIGDLVEIEEVDRPSTRVRAEIRGMHLGADGTTRLNLSFVPPLSPTGTGGQE
jgi:uncharacterized protein with GYD domain